MNNSFCNSKSILALTQITVCRKIIYKINEQDFNIFNEFWSQCINSSETNYVKHQRLYYLHTMSNIKIYTKLCPE